MSRFWVFLLLAILVQPSRAAHVKSLALRSWVVGLSPVAQIVHGSRLYGEIVYIADGKDKYILVSKEAPPQSIRSIQKRVREMGGDPDSLHVRVLGKSRSIFTFTTADQIHWFSTLGGYLQLTAGRSKIEGLARRFEGQVEPR
jgi:hypothetical protein